MVDFSPSFDYTISRAVNASVAQSVEQGTENPRVGGSIPPGGTIFSMSAKALVEKIIPPSQGIESWLLEICRWHISTSVALPVGRQPLCLLYTSPSPRDRTRSRMPSSA